MLVEKSYVCMWKNNISVLLLFTSWLGVYVMIVMVSQTEGYYYYDGGAPASE